jgi:hypothetical protein
MADDHTGHDIHGLIVEVWPDGSQTIDEDCECPTDCPKCKAENILRPD